LRDGETGFVVPQKDPAALVDRISRLLEDQGLRQRMGSAGRAFAASTYDMSLLTNQLLEIYERIVD
jgi:glycosyltransferase involved in cell wall biosynthesis